MNLPIFAILYFLNRYCKVILKYISDVYKVQIFAKSNYIEINPD
jgi:hypothetical protein